MILLLGIVALVNVESRAARVRELGLANMTGRADRIFVGECMERSVHDTGNGRPYTTYVFRVIQSIKGVEGTTVTFSLAATPDGRGFIGLPVFRVGEHRLLMLYPNGTSGLTSPMGLDQGNFHLVRGSNEKIFAVNGRGNQGLFKDIPPALMRAHGLVDRTGGMVKRENLQRVMESLINGEWQ